MSESEVKIAEVYYDGINLHTKLLKNSQVILDSTYELHQDCLLSSLISIAAKGYIIKTKNFSLHIQKYKKDY